MFRRLGRTRCCGGLAENREAVCGPAVAPTAMRRRHWWMVRTCHVGSVLNLRVTVEIFTWDPPGREKSICIN